MYVWIYIGISVPDVGRFYPVASKGETDTFTNSAFLQKFRLYACTLAFYNTGKAVQSISLGIYHNLCVQPKKLILNPSTFV
jgi:hypothetical protein